jgi:Protein of unknown function (DUF3006)
MQQAVADRFEGDKAVLLVGEDERRLVVGRGELPPETQEGSWMRVEIRDGALITAELDEAATADAKSRIAAKLKTLRQAATSRDETP